jgi:hypothetical protein
MAYQRGLWVWNSSTVLTDATYQKTFFNNCTSAKITDVFLYMDASWYAKFVTQLHAFITKATALNFKVWGLDGARQYFSDVESPKPLYDNIGAMIAYNAKAPATAKFCGFQTDNEPEDSSKLNAWSFHDDVPNSQLSTTTGGKWQKTAALDREMLCRDWLNTHATLRTTLHGAGLLLGAALPSWCDDYYGEPLYCTWNGKKASVMQHFMGILDTYNIMSYQTNINNVVSRVKSTMQYGSTLQSGCKVFAGVETHKGRGAAVTYGDNPSKNSKVAVLADITKLESLLKVYSAFGGINIHDYEGWVALK